MNLVSKSITSLMLLSICSSVSAKEIACHGCDEFAYEWRASESGRGIHYVYDFYNGNVRKYSTEGEPTPQGWQFYAMPLEVEMTTEQLVLEYSALYHQTGGTLQSWFDVDASDGLPNMTAHNVAGPGPGRTQLSAWLTAMPSLRNALPQTAVAIHALAAAAINIIKSNPLLTHVTVHFKDGSKIDVTYDAINNTVTAVEGSAVDSHGNVIPTTLSQVDGMQFDYTGAVGSADYNRMLQWLSNMGVKITNGAPRYACVEVGGNVVCNPI